MKFKKRPQAKIAKKEICSLDFLFLLRQGKRKGQLRLEFKKRPQAKIAKEEICSLDFLFLFDQAKRKEEVMNINHN